MAKRDKPTPKAKNKRRTYQKPVVIEEEVFDRRLLQGKCLQFDADACAGGLSDPGQS